MVVVVVEVGNNMKEGSSKKQRCHSRGLFVVVVVVVVALFVLLVMVVWVSVLSHCCRHF
jgi:hypothetical protein